MKRTLVRNVSAVLSFVLIFGFTFSYFQYGKKTVKAADDPDHQTLGLTEEEYNLAESYLTLEHSDQPYVYDNSGDIVYGDAETRPDLPPIDPKLKFSTMESASTDLGTTTESTTSGSLSTYYSYQISDEDMQSLENKLGTEKAQIIKDLMKESNDYLADLNLSTATIDTNGHFLHIPGIKDLGPDYDLSFPNLEECPAFYKECKYPETVQFGEDDYEFHLYGLKISYSAATVKKILNVGANSAIFLVGGWMAQILKQSITRSFAFVVGSEIFKTFTVPSLARSVIYKVIYGGYVFYFNAEGV
ncbi:hypothetical protein Q7A53_16605 [Halobacillus rhizosphaerae]|uniref:hypothetical protein n=1 Tax=Halobacillus rhizosphaerae TaxID=3064889 RepID=UPI00398B0092